MRRAARFEAFIFAVGLLGAAVAGVVGYQTVGLYGDGAFAGGLYRERDRQTGEWLLVRESTTSQGPVRRVFNNNLQLKSVDLDVSRDGRTDTSIVVSGGDVASVGFSLAGNGIIDAWAFRDSEDRLVKIEVSTRQDGTVDRWEHYSNNLLVRVDLDTNRNGKVDRWQTYEEGILMETFVDANEDGKPDGAAGGG